MKVGKTSIDRRSSFFFLNVCFYHGEADEEQSESEQMNGKLIWPLCLVAAFRSSSFTARELERKGVCYSMSVSTSQDRLGEGERQ